MKRIINYLIISLGVLLLTSCRKNLAEIEVPLSSVTAVANNSALIESGELLWYRHKGFLNGTPVWANNGTPIQVGGGWAGFKSVFASSLGVIYEIKTDGKLMWYRHHDYLQGTANWANGGVGIQVGRGWAGYKSVFAGSGVIYGIQTDGKLMWYDHYGYLDGTPVWAYDGTPIPVGKGWAGYKSVFAASGGVIYGIQTDGKLMWYKHNGYQDGHSLWANKGTPIQVGRGWAGYKSVFATSNGVIYGIQTDGKLMWYKHNGYLDGTPLWANNGTPIPVGKGWAGYKSVFAASDGVIYGINP